jgi:hypothetical protein
MPLDEQDYDVMVDIAKSLRRIADLLESDYLEEQINTIAAGIDRIADAVEGKDQ